MKRCKIKIAHITDIHVKETAALNKNIDVRENFKKVISRISGEFPDLVVLGGDQAAENGEMKAYRWIKAEMDKLAVAYCLLAGNHDVAQNLREIFSPDQELRDGLFCYQKEVKGHILFFLDSSSNLVSEKQLAWFRSKISNCNQEVLLFIHHPPALCGCEFMDSNYPLLNREETFSCLQETSAVKNIFCGHYHTEKTVVKGGKNIFITPSTMTQFSQSNPEHEISSYQPGWRIVEWDGECLETRVDYLDLDF